MERFKRSVTSPRGTAKGRGAPPSRPRACLLWRLLTSWVILYVWLRRVSNDLRGTHRTATQRIRALTYSTKNLLCHT